MTSRVQQLTLMLPVMRMVGVDTIFGSEKRRAMGLIGWGLIMFAVFCSSVSCRRDAALQNDENAPARTEMPTDSTSGSSLASAAVSEDAAASPTSEMHFSVPEKTRFASGIKATGTLKPERSAELAMAVPGTLVRVSVKRGQEVKAGQVLAVLDASGAQASLAQAEAGIAAAEAQLAAAEDAVKRVTTMVRPPKPRGFRPKESATWLLRSSK